MDKPSHPSVYSTAAILAAFSQASASVEELACGMVHHVVPAGPSIRDMWASVLRRWMPVLPRSASPPRSLRQNPVGRDLPPDAPCGPRRSAGVSFAGEDPAMGDKARRLVTSHFAFSDKRQADLGHD